MSRGTLCHVRHQDTGNWWQRVFMGRTLGFLFKIKQKVEAHLSLGCRPFELFELIKKTNFFIKKIGGVATVVTDLPCAGSITTQHPPICNPPLYNAVTSKTIT